ncbi:hypothetical protein [Flavobacterium sp. H4147]|uniref:hypothetical protein n=1 Tax=Flavobacterium sp. H4147 TaxID=3034149 RepID=UPI0023ECA695|nr:hypothetical protein [Flavobacterium sp. H4147]
MTPINWSKIMGYIRFTILPPNEDWQEILSDVYCDLDKSFKITQNKQNYTLDKCSSKLLYANSHHIFYKNESFGTILMESGFVKLEKFYIAYSQKYDNITVFTGHPECFDLYDIQIYNKGNLIRKSNWVGQELYNNASDILKPLYSNFLNTEIGEKTDYEELPHLLPLLYHFGWTQDDLNQNNWKLITTNLH